MRKKMSATKKPAKKYADGGSVRGRGISQGLRSTRASQPRVQEAERVMDASARRGMPADWEVQSGTRELAPIPEAALPTPPIPPRRRAAGRRAMTADELNEREMTRILNDRSLEAGRAGQNMYKRGGKVATKRK